MQLSAIAYKTGVFRANWGDWVALVLSPPGLNPMLCSDILQTCVGCGTRTWWSSCRTRHRRCWATTAGGTAPTSRSASANCCCCCPRSGRSAPRWSRTCSSRARWTTCPSSGCCATCSSREWRHVQCHYGYAHCTKWRIGEKLVCKCRRSLTLSVLGRFLA